MTNIKPGDFFECLFLSQSLFGLVKSSLNAMHFLVEN